MKKSEQKLLIEVTKENLRVSFDLPCIFLYREGKLYVNNKDVRNSIDEVIAFEMKVGEIGCYIFVTPSTPGDFIKVAYEKQDSLVEGEFFSTNTIEQWIKMDFDEGKTTEEKMQERLLPENLEKSYKRMNAFFYLKALSEYPKYESSNEEGFFWGDPIEEVIPFIEKYKNNQI